MALLKRLGLALALALFPFLGRASDSPQALLKEGNAAYEAGRYDEARAAYEKILGQGLESPALFYNLGNAYYRLGRMGPARLWYERALLRNPRDEDARYNVSLVRARVSEAAQAASPAAALGRHKTLLCAAAALLNLLFFAVLAVGLFREDEWIWWARWAVGFLFAAALGAAALARAQSRDVYGVILDARAEVRSAPEDNASVGFVAPEGQKVVVFDRLSPWTQVGLPEKGLKGWVRETAVQAIPLEYR